MGGSKKVEVQVETFEQELDLNQYGDASSHLDRIRSAININPVVVFGKTFCPFSLVSSHFGSQ